MIFNNPPEQDLTRSGLVVGVAKAHGAANTDDTNTSFPEQCSYDERIESLYTKALAKLKAEVDKLRKRQRGDAPFEVADQVRGSQAIHSCCTLQLTRYP